MPDLPPADTESTARLLERAKSGDGEAVNRLFERLSPRLKRWARGRLSPWARDLLDTDDLVQDALLETVKRLDLFQPRWDGALQAYLRAAVSNRICDALRQRGRRPQVVEVSGDELDAGPSPLDETLGSDLMRRYRAALGRLTPSEREGVLSRVEMGCSWAEIAETLGKPSPDAARVYVARALMRLAEEMGLERG